MDKFILSAREIKHVPLYNDNDCCIFCKYSKIEHTSKMNSIIEQNDCKHECGGYPAHDEIWCYNCGESIKDHSK